MYVIKSNYNNKVKHLLYAYTYYNKNKYEEKRYYLPTQINKFDKKQKESSNPKMITQQW